MLDLSDIRLDTSAQQDIVASDENLFVRYLSPNLQNRVHARENSHDDSKELAEIQRQLGDIRIHIEKLDFELHTRLLQMRGDVTKIIFEAGSPRKMTQLETTLDMVRREVAEAQQSFELKLQSVSQEDKKINWLLSEFEQRLLMVEEKQKVWSKPREEATGLTDVNDLLGQISLVEQGQNKPDKTLEEPASEHNINIDHTTFGHASGNISQHLQHEFADSIWEIAVFAFTRQLSLGASIVIVLCLILNISLLVLFTIQVNTLIQRRMEAFNEQAQAAFHFWRVTAGHSIDYQNPITKASMVSSVCNLHRFVPQSNLQLDLADQLTDYLEEDATGIPAGHFMCILALIVWYLTVIVEVRSIIDVLRACFAVPSGPRTTFEQDHDDPSKVKFVFISPGRRCFLAGILLARMGVAGILFWEGTVFLITEVQIENMILNSMALQMILDFDELLVALLPKIPQAVTSYILPVPIRVRCFWWDNWGLFVALSCSLITIFSLFQVFFMDPFIDNLRASYDGLCGGEPGSWDFVVGVDGLGIPWAAPTPPSQDELPHGYIQEAMEIAKHSGFHNRNLESKQRDNMGSFMQVASGDILRRMMVDMPEFKDPTDWQLFDPFVNADVVGWSNESLEIMGYKDFADQPGTVYNNYLKFLLGKEGTVSCAQVPFSLCTKPGRDSSALVFRKLCPGRCGCDSPSEGTMANYYGSSSKSGHTGCPAWSTRRKSFVDALKGSPCADTEDLIEMSLWADGAGDVMAPSGNCLADEILSAFDSGGCSDVAKMKIGALKSRICDETSLPAICPGSCGCDARQPYASFHTPRVEYCPYSCNRTQPLCLTTEINHPPDLDAGTKGPFAGLACTFPFKYKGETYNTCTYKEWPGPWCAVKLHDGASEFWGDCPDTVECIGSQAEALP